MELFLKRNFWIVPALVVALAAALLARISLHIVEGAYLLDEGKKPAKVARVPSKAVEGKQQTTEKDADAIASRDIFCSTCAPAALPTSQPAGDPAAGGQIPATTLPLALVGTFVASDPRISAATVINTQLNRSGIFGVDEEIPGAGPIVAIAPRWVDFKNSSANRVERLDLLGVPKAGKEPPKVADKTPATPAAPASPEGDLAAELDKGIKKVDDTHYQIDRALVDKILGDPNLVTRGARIVPSVVNGKPNGFKVYAIRPNSAYAKIGLQNGDTLHSINGFEMTSPDKALEVYTKLKSASSLTVTMTRRGEETTMNYVIK